MRMIFDNEYEDLNASVIRRTDPNKYCLLIEQAGTNLSQSIIETHWHEWLEITYIIEGAMQVQFPDGQLEVNEGQVALIGMQTLHKITGDTGEYHFKCLHINFGLISQYVNPSVLMDKVILIQNAEYFIKVLENIDALMDSDAVVSRIRYQSNLLELLAICIEEIENASENDFPKGSIDFFSKILFYLGEHYQENLSLDQVAKHFGYSSQHLSLMFKKQLGINYKAYLTRIRLEKVKFLLINTENKLLEIALESGFSSEHSLIKNFKKVYRLTPTEYRRENRIG